MMHRTRLLYLSKGQTIWRPLTNYILEWSLLIRFTILRGLGDKHQQTLKQNIYNQMEFYLNLYAQHSDLLGLMCSSKEWQLWGHLTGHRESEEIDWNFFKPLEKVLV